MKLMVFLGALAIASGQAIVSNLDTAKWDESGGVLLRTDPASGGMDLARPISCRTRNSRRTSTIPTSTSLSWKANSPLHQDTGDTPIKTGGFAFLPAKEVQRLSCTSKTQLHILSFLGWESEVASCEINHGATLITLSGSRRLMPWIGRTIGVAAAVIPIAIGMKGRTGPPKTPNRRFCKSRSKTLAAGANSASDNRHSR